MLGQTRKLADPDDFLFFNALAEQGRDGLLGLHGELHLAELLGRLDVDVPVHKAVGQADVQPLLADGEGELVVTHHRESHLLGFVENHHLLDLRRKEGVLDEHPGIRVIAQHVDLLALHLADDGLDSDPLEADTGAHGVHIFPVGVDRDLGPVARLPDDLVDLDRMIVQLRHLQLEDLLDEVRMGAGQHDLKARGRLDDLVNQGPNTIIRVVDLPGRLVLLGQNPFGLPQIHEDVAVALPLVVADDHLTDLLFELRVQRVSLDLPQRLPGLLLGTLHGTAIELLRTDLDEQLIADLAFLVELQSLFEGDLVHRVFHFVDDPLARKHRDLGSIVAETDNRVVHGTELLLVGGKQGLFDGLADQLFGNAALLNQLLDRLGHACSHGLTFLPPRNHRVVPSGRLPGVSRRLSPRCGGARSSHGPPRWCHRSNVPRS